jgi:hypothetical protein
VVPSNSATPITSCGFEPTRSKGWHPTPRCISCGRRGFVDPFPRGMENAEISPPTAST